MSGAPKKPQILVLGGTTEGRAVGRALRAAGFRVLLSTVSAYAAELAADDAAVRDGALGAESLATLVRAHDAVVDATHPFAVDISRAAIEVAAAEDRPYVRVERADTLLPPLAQPANDHAEAAELAMAKAKEAESPTVLLTIGSKHLAVYAEAARVHGVRVIVRVLPTVEALHSCAAAGIAPSDIIAMQGPTSAALDVAMLRHFGASVLVTKESGDIGAVTAKLDAAQRARAAAVVVMRPKVEYPNVVADEASAVEWLREALAHE